MQKHSTQKAATIFLLHAKVHARGKMKARSADTCIVLLLLLMKFEEEKKTNKQLFYK